MSWINVARMDFPAALAALCKWAFEEPYSIAPYMQMSWIECLEDRFNDAVQTTKSGLIANPDSSHLANNLTFALLRLGRDREAATAFAAVKKCKDFEEDAAYLAINGLLLMRQGDLEKGRELYGEALQRTKKRKDRRLAVRVALNYLMSEYDVTRLVDGQILEAVTQALKGERDSSVLSTARPLRYRLQTLQEVTKDAKLKDQIGDFVAVSTAEESAFRQELQKNDAPNFPATIQSDNRNMIFETELLPALGNQSRKLPPT